MSLFALSFNENTSKRNISNITRTGYYEVCFEFGDYVSTL